MARGSRKTARGRRGGGPGRGGMLVAALVLIAIAVFVLGLAALVTIPGTLVIIALVLARPASVGQRLRAWRLWQRLRGLEQGRSAGTFVGMLAVYGVLVPGACLALLIVVAVHSGSNTYTNSTGDAPTRPSEPAPSTPAPAVAAQTTGTPATAPSPADPCHQHGITYCALNPAVTQATIDGTICVAGWSSSVRPPESYTEQLKYQQIAAEGLPGSIGSYEEDHRIPLELGGAPSDPMNLSPEYPRSPNPKDSDENTLHDEVCSGQLTLRAAQQQMVAV